MTFPEFPRQKQRSVDICRSLLPLNWRPKAILEVNIFFFDGRIQASQLPHILICVVILPRKNRKKIRFWLTGDDHRTNQNLRPKYERVRTDSACRRISLLFPHYHFTTISYCLPLTECNFFDWPQASVGLAISKMSDISSYQNKNAPVLQAKRYLLSFIKALEYFENQEPKMIFDLHKHLLGNQANKNTRLGWKTGLLPERM